MIEDSGYSKHWNILWYCSKVPKTSQFRLLKLCHFKRTNGILRSRHIFISIKRFSPNLATPKRGDLIDYKIIGQLSYYFLPACNFLINQVLAGIVAPYSSIIQITTCPSSNPQLHSTINIITSVPYCYRHRNCCHSCNILSQLA
jgi:hypothetical protein